MTCVSSAMNGGIYGCKPVSNLNGGGGLARAEEPENMVPYIVLKFFDLKNERSMDRFQVATFLVIFRKLKFCDVTRFANQGGLKHQNISIENVPPSKITP